MLLRSLHPLLLLFLLLHLLPPALSLARGSAPVLPPLLPSAPPPLPVSETAYVAIHTHTHSHRDLYQRDGILTMFGTLSETQSPHPRVVLVTHSTPLSFRSAYADAGLLVTPIPDPGYHDQCELKFNRLHLWSPSLLPYSRVVFLDSDVLVVYNLDHLFQCGRFCMVYSSLQHFTDSLMVVRPDAAIHARLLDEYRGLRLREALWTSVWCPEESWHFFLRAFGNIEAAPLFDPRMGQSDAPLQRLSSSTCLNAMMWYEFFSYRLLRGPMFRNWTDADGIPAYSLGWTGLKPYNWAPGLFFNLNWLWHAERDRVLQRTYGLLIAQWALACAIMAWVGAVGVRWTVAWLMRERKKGETGWRLLNAVRSALVTLMGSREEDRRKKPTDPKTSPTSSPSFTAPSAWSLPYSWLPRWGVVPVSAVLAMASINLNGWPLYWSIYILTPPHIAFSILATAHCLLTYVDLQAVRYLFHYAPQYPHASSADERVGLLDPETAATHKSAYAWTYAGVHGTSPVVRWGWWQMWAVVFWEWFVWLSMRSSVYTEFVIKMFAVFPFVAFMYVAHVNAWRDVLGQIKAEVDSMADDAGGRMSSASKPLQRPRGGSAR